MSDDEAFRGTNRRWTEDYLRVGGLEIPYVTRAKAIAAIDRSFEDRGQLCVAFCNANTMLRAFDSSAYTRMLSRFLVLNDGVGVDICSRLFNGRPFEENLNGTDFVPALLEDSRHDLRIFLLGARPGVADEAGEVLAGAFTRHTIVGTHDGYFTDADVPGMLAGINRAAPDMVLVALGNPRQEAFVAAHGAALDAPVIVMVGALFDFLAGDVVRAPRLVRALRAEWLFRLAQEPRRLGRRYTIDVVRFFAKIVWLRAKRSSEELDALPARRLRPGA